MNTIRIMIGAFLVTVGFVLLAVKSIMALLEGDSSMSAVIGIFITCIVTAKFIFPTQKAINNGKDAVKEVPLS